jgi:predicted PurR-regulated permease PerM
MKRLFSLEQYLLVLGIGVLFLAIMFPFVQAVLLGLFFAVLLNPAFLLFKKVLRLPTTLGAVFFVLFFCLLVILPLLLVGASLVNDVNDLISYFRNNEQQIREQFWQTDALKDINNFIEAFVGPELLASLNEKLLLILGNIGKGLLNFLGLVATKLPGFFIDIGIFLLSLFFGLIDGPRLVEVLRSVLPFDSQTTNRLIQTSDNICRGVMLGTSLVSIAQSLIIGIGFWLTGIPNPLFFGSITAMFSIIPLVGSAPVGFGGVIYLLLMKKFGAAFVMLGFAFAATLSDNVIKPLVLQGFGSLHPMLAILSAIGGLALMGVLGLFLGPLIAALTVVVLKIMIEAPKEAKA